MKKWFLERFLPMWAKQTVMADYQAISAENRTLNARNRELRSYIRGLEKGLRIGRKLQKKQEATDGNL